MSLGSPKKRGSQETDGSKPSRNGNDLKSDKMDKINGLNDDLGFLSRRMTRRQALTTGARAAIGVAAVAVVGAGAYAAYEAANPPKAQTKTVTSTSTATSTAVSTTTSTVAPPTTSAGPIDISFFTYTGANLDVVPKQVFADYTQANPNVTISVSEGTNAASYPQMLAALQAGQPPLYNASYVNANTIESGASVGMWEALNMSNIPNASQLFPQFVRSDNLGVPVSLTTIGLAYNTSTVTTPPTSWADILTPGKYPKQVWLFQGVWYYLVMAAILNGGSVTNIMPGITAWEAAAGNIAGFATSNAQIETLLAQNELDILAGYFPANIGVFENAGLPVKYVVPSEGQMAFPVYLCAVTGTTPTQLAAIENIFNELVSPSSQANWVESTLEAPMNSQTVVPAATATEIGYSATSIPSLVEIDWLTYAQNTSNWATLWNQYVTPLIP